MKFTEMDPEEVTKLLQGVPDIITPEVKKQDAFLRMTPCRSCGSTTTTPTINKDLPFRRGEILPNRVLLCNKCNAMTDPTTGLIIRAPS